MADEGKRYLVIFEIADSSPQRLAIVVPKIMTALQHMASGPIEQAVRSIHADVFAYGVRSRLNAGQIYAALQSPRQDSREIVRDPILDGEDHVCVLELAEGFSCGPGFTRFGTWLQRH